MGRKASMVALSESSAQHRGDDSIAMTATRLVAIF